MEGTEEIKQFRFMTYLNLSSVARKIGNNRLCEKYIKKAEAMIEDLFENPSTDDPYSLLVSSYVYSYIYGCVNLCYIYGLTYIHTNSAKYTYL